MYIGTDARVDADRADVCAVAAAAVDQIYGVEGPVDQSVKVLEERAFLAEHAAEVVAGAGGEGGDRHILQQRRAVDALVEGAVSAAGVDAQFLPSGGLTADLLRRVHRGFGHVDLCLAAVPKRPGDLRTNAFGLVAASGDGIDDKQMLHFRRPSYL